MHEEGRTIRLIGRSISGFSGSRRYSSRFMSPRSRWRLSAPCSPGPAFSRFRRCCSCRSSELLPALRGDRRIIRWSIPAHDGGSMHDFDRRKFLQGTAVTLAGAQLGALHSGTRLNRIKAGVLDVAYIEAGPATGNPVVLLHGWPYDV